VSASDNSPPRCVIIAGCNGAGKTTFAREYLPREAAIVHFVNADLIASGLSPLRPELANVAAGRLFLRELDRLAKARASFAFETTLSGLTYVARLKQWKASGYRIDRLSPAPIAPAGSSPCCCACAPGRSSCSTRRHSATVHARLDKLSEPLSGTRRCVGGLRQLGQLPALGSDKLMKKKHGTKRPGKFASTVGEALRRAGQAARKTARIHGTPIYVWQNGKVVSEKP
jgi:hypothetical protein